MKAVQKRKGRGRSAVNQDDHSHNTIDIPMERLPGFLRNVPTENMECLTLHAAKFGILAIIQLVSIRSHMTLNSVRNQSDGHREKDEGLGT